MGYSIECEILGKPATIHVDTIEELRELIGYGNVVKTRTIATKRVAKSRTNPTRSNKAGKTKRGSRGWGPDVYEMAKSRNISPLAARSELAKQKRTGKKKPTTKKSAA